jgi:DNA-binding HxlR family transcriptional regulator
MTTITDDQIIKVLTDHGRCMTYVVANWLRDFDKKIETPFVLRRLKKLEKIGKVQRVKSPYRVQICWSAL